jgi:ribose transport system substrate-binding protein/inositol transport system substrate-binding protein
MKKLMVILVCAMMVVVGVTGCGGGGGAGEGEDADAAGTSESTDADAGAVEGGKYALVMSHMTNAFVTTFSNGASEKAAELGVDLTVFDGNQDAATQISQIESCITQGYIGIMVEPVSVDGLKPAVLAANEAGIPIITVVQQISDQDLAMSYVGGNEINAGELEMTKAIEAIGGKGNIAILYGPMGSDAQLIRKQGYDNILAEYPDVKVVFEQTANWTSDEALKVTENWLQTGTEINAVVAQNDGMAVGAMKAVEDAKMRDSIQIFGIDATPDGVAAISEGRMDGTVSQDTPGMGKLSMQTIYDIVQGETVEPIIYTEAQWVDASNVDQYK